MKKIKWYLMSILPVLMTLVLQLVASFFITIRYIIRYGTEVGAQRVMDSLMEITVMTQVLSFLVAGLWYYLLVIRKKGKREEQEKPLFSWKSLGGIFCLAIGAQLLIGLLLGAWEFFSPEQIEAYNQLIEESGIGELTLFSAIATVVMAPLEEELVCRGLTVEYLKRAGASFWVINVLQALFFGIMHMNLVQGTYAFLVGLICGYLVLKYKSLLASMFFHCIFNGYATFGGVIVEKLEEINAAVYYIGTLVIGVAVFFLGIWLFKKDIKRNGESVSAC